MLGEKMIMAFHAIMANKMRSLLTMLGIIIGIGSVISIVSIGDTMRGLFADLYKDAGATQAVVSIGYNVEDVRDSDYFTLDELDKIKEIFGDEISYIDSYASVNSEVLAGRTNMKFDFQGIDWNFSDVRTLFKRRRYPWTKEKCGDRGGECQKTFRNGKRGGKDLPDHRLRGYRHVYGSRCLQKRDERLPEAFVRRFRRYGIRVYPVYTAHMAE